MLKDIVRGYSLMFNKIIKFLLSILKIIIFIVAVLGLSTLIVYPLWLFSSKSAENYTLFVLSFTIIALILYFIVKISFSINKNGLKITWENKLKPVIAKLIRFIFYFIATIIIISLFTHYNILIGIISLIVFFGLFGIVRFGFKK